MIVAECLAPVRWVERVVSGRDVEVLQQQWKLTSYPDVTDRDPMPRPYGVAYEWRDVPTVALDANDQEIPPCPTPNGGRQWCRVHRKWETPAEWFACDSELYQKGFRNVGGRILQVDAGEDESP